MACRFILVGCEAGLGHVEYWASDLDFPPTAHGYMLVGFPNRRSCHAFCI